MIKNFKSSFGPYSDEAQMILFMLWRGCAERKASKKECACAKSHSHDVSSFGCKTPQNRKNMGSRWKQLLNGQNPKMPEPVINTFNAIIDDMTSSRFNKEL